MSVSTRAGLQMLKQELERRGPRIKRSASLTKISFGEVQDEYFTVHAWWVDGELIKRITWEGNFRVGHNGPVLVRMPCNIARLLVRDILIARGI